MKRVAVGFAAVVAFVVLAIIPARSQAAAVLAVDVWNDGTFDFAIADNDGADLDAAVGVIAFRSIGAYVIDITAGATKPVLGSSGSPQMDLRSIISSTVPSLVVRTVFVDQGFDFSGALAADLEGATTGTIAAAVQTGAFVDLISLGTFGPGAFLDSAAGAATLAPADLLILSTVVTQSGEGARSYYDFAVKAVPEPGAMMLLGSGLIGLAGWGRMKYRK